MSKDILHSGVGLTDEEFKGSSHSFLDHICYQGAKRDASDYEYRFFCEDQDENFKSRLEFLNQLERQESKKYGTEKCDHWF